MKQIISNYRYWVLFALASVIIIGLIVVPSTDTTFGMYAAVIFGSKAAALAALLAFCHYYMFQSTHPRRVRPHIQQMSEYHITKVHYLLITCNFLNT